MKKLLSLLLATLMLLSLLTACNPDAEEIDWINIRLGYVLPEPQSNLMKVISNDDDSLVVYIHEISQNQYLEYQRWCEQEKGFNVEPEVLNNSFYAYNKEGYYLSLFYSDSQDQLHISLKAPIPMGEFSLPDYATAAGLPVPESQLGHYHWQDENSFFLYVGGTTKDNYMLYKEACISAGFSIAPYDYDTVYSATNIEGYKVSLNYEGFNTFTIDFTSPKDIVNLDEENNSTDYTLDYSDAASFETALNDGIPVNGAIVQFCINEYHPDSILGINCWAGEHLNFISDHALEISAGDTIIGKVTQEPTSTIGSWVISYEVLSITKGEESSRIQKNGFNSATNETYTFANYTIEIPNYWMHEKNISGGIQRYAEMDGKVAMLQICAVAETDDSYPVTFDGLMTDNENMIAMIEHTAFKEVTDYEIIDTGVIKGIMYNGIITDETSGLTGYAKWFEFASEADGNWCSIILSQTDNTEYQYTDDFMKMIQSIKVKGNETGNPSAPESQPTKITLTMGDDDFKGMNYKDAEKIFRDMGFTKFKYQTVKTETESAANTIYYIDITEWIFGDTDFVRGDKFDADSTIYLVYYKYETPEAPSPVYYSTNDYQTAKKGNSGIFSYKNKGGSYDVYWIIDFDAGYVYYFTEGNGESTCDRVRIVSGTLNDKITVTWHDGGDQWSWFLHFKYVNSPVTLIVNDHFGGAVEFTTTDLNDALALRATKTIKDY